MPGFPYKFPITWASLEVVDLPLVIAGVAGENVPAPWADLPYTNFIRAQLIAAATTALASLGQQEEQGLTVLALARACPEIFAITRGLDSGLNYFGLLPHKKSLLMTDQGLHFLYPLIPAALKEAQSAFGYGTHYTNFFLNAIKSDLAIQRVSGIATFIVWCSIFQLHPKN